MTKTIHYQKPNSLYHACGAPGAIRQSTDIAAVTCKKCLNTVTGRKGSNRQIGDERMIQKVIKVALPQELLERLEAQPNQSEAVREALSKYL